MANWEYKRDESRSAPVTGIQRCCIIAAEETISKTSGKPMIIVTVKPSGSNAKVKNYIVKNEYFNRNMTQFFDAFPSVGEGNFNLFTWVGALGAANFGLDADGYLKVKWFVSPANAEHLPPFEGEKPIKQDVATLDEEDDDELPFEL